MRTALLGVILISGTISIALFFVLWTYKLDMWNIVSPHPPFYWNPKEFIREVAEVAKDIDLPPEEAYEIGADPDTWGDFEPVFSLCDRYTGIYIYGEDGLYRTGMPAEFILDVDNPVLHRSLDLFFMDQYQFNIIYPMTFRNETGEIVLVDYHPIRFIYPYVILSALFCIGLFLAAILLYINSRIKNILIINREISLMASGDLTHPVPSVGRDEIGSLGTELDKLRLALSSYIQKEESARKSNQDLITSMSHDLRTPLTILYGYLEVLKLKSKDSALPGDYLERCLKKASDIRELTDRMFEYALVYEVDETPEFTELSTDFLRQCLCDHLDFLHLAGFDTEFFDSPLSVTFFGDVTMLKRILTNLFSNVLKYGDKKQQAPCFADCPCVQNKVTVRMTVTDAAIFIQISNAVKSDLSEELSNGIGLKSVQKMVELHRGTFCSRSEDLFFTAELTLPVGTA